MCAINTWLYKYKTKTLINIGRNNKDYSIYKKTTTW